ncbi:MAG: YdcF family protein [Chloroflexota bacterium]|nr:YdcF family protein [Chloroflexota bacterium]
MTDPRVAKPRFRRATWVRSLLLTAVFVLALIPLLIAGAVIWQARTDEARRVDAIVVLGAAQYNGRPSNVLSARLDHAFDLYEQGIAPTIVVTGGRAEGDTYTEAESGSMYLQERGVPDSAILMESEGTDTWTSMQGVADVLRDTDLHRILLVSDGFHLLRSELMARELGLEAYSSAAPNSPIRPWSGAELAYVIRETGGIVVFAPKML